MTHARPLPDAAQAPWPAHPAPIGEKPEAPAVVAPTAEMPAPTAKTTTAETLAPVSSPATAETSAPAASAHAKIGLGTKLGVGAAIGSAAVAAALLYVNHGRKR